MTKYKLVMLDFDGTTACTVPCIFHASRKMLRGYGYEIEYDCVKENFGHALETAFCRFAGAEFDAQTIEKMKEEYGRIYKEEGEQLIELFPNVVPTLKHLKELGVKVFIASNNVRPVLDRLTSRLGIAEYIDDIVSVEDVENVKPAPDIAIEALRRTGIAASEALVVGDTTYDMDMGAGAKCPLCGVSFGSHTPEVLRAAGAKYIIDDFAELVEIVING